MTKRIRAKHKIDRRLRVNLWGRPKSPFNTREYGPGLHGQRRRKQSNYGTQLQAKQKLKGYYGSVGEKQFRRYYADAVRQNLSRVADASIDHVLILSGDQLYRMNFRHLMQTHLESSADVTLCSIPVTRENSASFGILQTDPQGRIVDFSEKPKNGGFEILVGMTQSRQRSSEL